MKHIVKRHEVVQPLDQSYRIIPLTRNQTVMVDVADYEWLMQWKWMARGGAYIYAARSDNGPYMHRVIMDCSRSMMVDHINQNTLDNRRSNLRICTRSENTRNRKTPSTNKSGLKGAQRQGNRWLAAIRVDGQRLLLGRFSTPEEAHEAYCKAAVMHFGEFARGK